MLFTTGRFILLFLPLTLAAFFLLGRLKRLRSAALSLVIASLFFYASWRPIHVFLLAASIAFNYGMGSVIATSRAGGRPRRSKHALILAITVDLATLAYFKYSDFLIASIDSLGTVAMPLPHILLPLGISFFTFTQIAYLVDVHAGKVVERSPLNYSLFVTYFPHLIAGPVLHHAQMMPQFRAAEIYRPQSRQFAVGMAFLLIGLFKKVLVADSFAPTANLVFGYAQTSSISSLSAWTGIVAYTIQIYFDFSGYSDMAVGLSRLFNVRLPYNFDSPYKSLSIIDFWRRWHMTLSAFLRDYLYFSLGGNRKGTIRRYINLLVTMVLGGLWHGAAWTFVAWGALHGLYLVLNHGWRWLRGRIHPRFPLDSKWAKWLGNAAASALTMSSVMLAWVFFRASDFHSAKRVVLGIFGASDAASAMPDQPNASWWLLALLVFAIARFAPNSQELVDNNLARRLDNASIEYVRPTCGFIIGACAALAIVLVMIAQSRTVTEFIYFNF